jgi:acetyl-CoA carboxylase biotin carboxyl carrier protein
MDLKEIQNLIKFVANSGVAEVKLKWMILKSPLDYYRRHCNRNYLCATMPAHNQQAMPVQNAASSGCCRHTCCRRKYITIKSPIIGTF